MELYRYYFDCNTEKIDKTLSKLQKNLAFSNILYDKEILSNEGFFYLKDNKYYKKNINYNNYYNEIHIDYSKSVFDKNKPLIFYKQKNKDFFYTKNEVFQNTYMDHIFLINRKENDFCYYIKIPLHSLSLNFIIILLKIFILYHH